MATVVHACAETTASRSGANTDGGVPDGGAAHAHNVEAAMPGDAAHAGEAELQPLSSCVQQSQDVRIAPPMVVSTLASLCDALAAAGIAQCPDDRAGYLQQLDQECRSGRAFPLFDRRCGIDHVVIRSDDTSVSWYFDAATGALIGARALLGMGTRLPCGPASVYRGGAALPICSSSEGACSLCVAEPDECPPDISAAIATAPCSPMATEAASCSCGDESPSRGVSLPEHAATCGNADQCAHCSSGTCAAACRCWRTGERRYVVECTE